MASVFCEHRRVRTICPSCKPAPAPPPQAPPPPTGRLPGRSPEADDEAPPASLTPRGPGKPLLPQRRRKRAPTRAEAEGAEAWWVRK